MVQLNPEVKKKIQKPDEINDQCLKWLATAAQKAAQPLTKAWMTLSELEFEIQQDQDTEDTISDAFMPLKEDGEGEQMNLSQIIRDLKHGIK